MTSTRYIDKIIIPDYTNKNDCDAWYLDAISISEYDRDNLVALLLKDDPAFQDHVLDFLQSLINVRLSHAYSRDKYNQGFVPQHNQMNGEVNWIFKGDNYE